MPFELAFLDWLQQFHNPVLDALAVFLNYAGEHGEIWIAFTLLLLLFRRTRKAGCAMATALVLYLVAGITQENDAAVLLFLALTGKCCGGPVPVKCGRQSK